MKRVSMADRGKSGEGPDLTAAEILRRLDRSETAAALEAAAMSADAWAAKVAEEEKRRGLKMGALPSREAVMMQGLAIPLCLHTSHHPSLAAAFPRLVLWVRQALGYIVELEERARGLGVANAKLHHAVERADEQVARSHAAAESAHEARAIAERELASVREELEAQLDIRKRVDRLNEERHAGMQEQIDAWRLSAQATASALHALETANTAASMSEADDVGNSSGIIRAQIPAVSVPQPDPPYEFSPNWLHGVVDGQFLTVNRYSGRVSLENDELGFVEVGMEDREMWGCALSLAALLAAGDE